MGKIPKVVYELSSKLNPKNTVDAVCYQLEDEIKKLRSFSFLGNKDTVLHELTVISRYVEYLKNRVEAEGIKNVAFNLNEK